MPPFSSICSKLFHRSTKETHKFCCVLFFSLGCLVMTRRTKRPRNHSLSGPQLRVRHHLWGLPVLGFTEKSWLLELEESASPVNNLPLLTETWENCILFLDCILNKFLPGCFSELNGFCAWKIKQTTKFWPCKDLFCIQPGGISATICHPLLGTVESFRPSLKTRTDILLWRWCDVLYWACSALC